MDPEGPFDDSFQEPTLLTGYCTLMKESRLEGRRGPKRENEKIEKGKERAWGPPVW
jgi:hypothetical protein